MELVEYIRIFRKWLWVLILAALLGGSLGYLVRSRQSATYQAAVLIEVGGFMRSPNPESSEIRAGVELAQTYVILAKTRSILEAAIEAEDFPLTMKELQEIIQARIITGTSLLQITATHTEPLLTADIANAVARQIILNSPTHLTAEQQQQVALIDNEIDSLSGQLRIARQRLDEIDSQLQFAEDATDITNLRAQRSVVVTEISETSATLAQFTSTITELQARVNSLDIVEEARIPEEPVGPGILSVAILGGVLGVSLTAGVVLVVEYLDDTIKTPEQVVEHTTLPVLGKISNYRQAGQRPSSQLVAHTDPTMFVAEEYRSLRTQLLFATGDSNLHTIFTSASPGEGKSVTVANLAITLAAARYRVLLIDADLRRPSQHQLFVLSNKKGLTTLLSREPQEMLVDPTRLILEKEYDGIIQKTEIEGLRVVTSGPEPANPSEALGSNYLRLWFDVFEKATDIDVILVDTPPVMTLSDASVIATTTGLPMVLVLRAGRTRRANATEAKAQLTQLGLKLRGVILNDVKRRDQPLYERGYYNNYYQASADTFAKRNMVAVVREPSTNGQRLIMREPKTAPLDGRPALPLDAIRNLQADHLLLMIGGNKEPIVVDIKERVTFGRIFDDAPNNHVVLDDYDALQLGVSRMHAAIYRRSNAFLLEDLGSANGTWLNNQIVSPGDTHEVFNNDSVRFGDLQLWVYYRVQHTEASDEHVTRVLDADKAE